jgi:transketolase
MLEHVGSVHLRSGRIEWPEICQDDAPFVIGKANTVREGNDVAIIVSGLMVGIALDAAAALAMTGVQARVIDMHTIKPLDEDAIIKAVTGTGRIVVTEEHLMAGGPGSADATVVARTKPVPMEFVNVGDCCAESGDPPGLLQKYGLTAEAILAAVNKVCSR